MIGRERSSVSAAQRERQRILHQRKHGWCGCGNRLASKANCLECLIKNREAARKRSRAKERRRCLSRKLEAERDTKLMEQEIETLGEALPKEVARCRELLLDYAALPNGVGAFGHAAISQDIRRAENAIASDDVVGMLLAYRQLKECK